MILAAFGNLGDVVLWRWVACTLARADANGLGERIAEAASRPGLKPSEGEKEAGRAWDSLPPLLAWLEDPR